MNFKVYFFGARYILKQLGIQINKLQIKRILHESYTYLYLGHEGRSPPKGRDPVSIE
jgi:hypothetical protein